MNWADDAYKSWELAITTLRKEFESGKNRRPARQPVQNHADRKSVV